MISFESPLEDRRVTDAASTASLFFDGRLIIIDRSRSRLFVYNESARLIWQSLQQGADAGRLVTELAQAYGIAPQCARTDIDAILRHWRSQGFIGSPRAEPPDGACLAGGPSSSDRRIDASHAAQVRRETWVCTLGGHAIAFDVEGSEWIARLRAMFAHLETPDAHPETCLCIRQADDRFCLLQDGAERLRSRNTGLLIGALYQALLERIHSSAAWLALIHAGAIGKNGAAVVLPAPSGSGKSTLLAYLMTQEFHYLSDDLAALAAPDGKLVPWPMPLSIKPGSFDALSRFHGALERFPMYRSKGMRTRLIIPPPEAWAAPPTPVRALVFPRYVAKAAGALVSIAPAEALQHLLADRIWLGHPLAEDQVRAFLGWLETVPAFTLNYGRLQEARHGIEQVLAR